MIDVTKVRMMTKLAMYEKQFGKKELRMHRYSRRNYLWIKMFTCFLAVTAAYILGAGLYLMRYYTTFINNVEFASYVNIILALLVIYLILILFCLVFTYRYETKRYAAMLEHIKQYDIDLHALKTYLDEEDHP